MPTIAERSGKWFKDEPRILALLQEQTRRGLEKYGHTLDDYDAPEEHRVAHLVQEMVDAVQYAHWAGMPILADMLSMNLGGIMKHFPDLDVVTLLRREEGDAG